MADAEMSTIAVWGAGLGILAVIAKGVHNVFSAGRYSKDQEAALVRIEASFTAGFSKFKSDMEMQLVDKFHKLEMRLLESDQKNTSLSEKVLELQNQLAAAQRRQAATAHKVTELSTEIRSLKEHLNPQ